MSKQQKKFQIDITHPHEILPFLSFPGVTVLELYARWCGPTPAVEQAFRQYYLQYSGAPLRFVRAPSDILPFARRYHGRCRPVFLMIQGGVIVRAFCGVNLPELDRYFSDVPAKLPQTVEELPEAKPFIPEAQMRELAADEQFAKTWVSALQQRAEALEQLEIARQNNLDADVDPEQKFDIIIQQYTESWAKLDQYDDVAAACFIETPGEDDYAALQSQQTNDEKLAQFIGDMQQIEQHVQELAEPPEAIIARMLPKYQQFYEQAPERIDIAQVFDQCANLQVAAADPIIISQMAQLADYEHTGEITKLDCCLIASTVEFRPRLAAIRDGSAVYLGQQRSDAPEALEGLENAQQDNAEQQQPESQGENEQLQPEGEQTEQRDEQQKSADEQEDQPNEQQEQPADENEQKSEPAQLPAENSRKSEHSDAKSQPEQQEEQQEVKEPESIHNQLSDALQQNLQKQTEEKPASDAGESQHEPEKPEEQRPESEEKQKSVSEHEQPPSDEQKQEAHPDQPEALDNADSTQQNDPANVPMTLEEPMVDQPASDLKNKLQAAINEDAPQEQPNSALKSALAASLKDNQNEQQ